MCVRCETKSGFRAFRAGWIPGDADMPSKNYLLRQVATIMKFAKETDDPEIAARLLAKAAALNEKLDEIDLRTRRQRCGDPAQHSGD